MNKKLKKGLTTTMAAAMGLGVVIPAVPVIAAPATSGWVKTAAGWTLLKSGVKTTGWQKDAGTWYLLDANGIMLTGWQKDATGTWYYLNADGSMKTGWKQDTDGKWYFLKTSGAMAASTWVGNYYLGASGAMLVSTVTPDGYTVDANGAWDGQPSASEKYAELKAAVDAKVKAFTDLANGDLSTQELIDAAKVAAGKIDLTGLTSEDTLAVDAIVTAAYDKVDAAQKVIDDAKTYAELKADAETKVAAYEAATADLSTQALVDAANAAKAVVSLNGLTDADKATFQTRIDAADAKVADAVAKLAVLKVDSVSAITSKSLEVTFSGAVDTAKAVINVKRDGIKSNVTSITWNDAKTVATIELTSKISKAEYTVDVTGAADTTLTGSVSAEDEKVANIEILSTEVPLADLDADASADDLSVPYKVTNQYGEDITKTTSIIASNGVVDAAKGVVNFVGNYDTVTNKTVAFTLINVDSNVSTTGVVTAVSAAKESSIEIKGIYNKDGKTLTETTDLSKDKFFIEIEVKDQYGNVVADPNAASLILSESNNTIADVNDSVTPGEPVLDTTTVDGKVLVAINKPAAGLKAGSTTVTFISKNTGKSATTTVNVAEGIRANNVTLGQPELVAAGEDALIPVTALDKDGNAITDLDILNNPVRGLGLEAGNTLVLKDGVVYVKVPSVTVGPKVAIVTVIPTQKIVTVNYTVKAAAVPTVIAGLDKEIQTSISAGLSQDITGADLIVEDQYGRTMADADVNTWLAVAGNSVILTSSKEATDNSPFTVVSTANGSDAATQVITATADAFTIGAKAAANLNSTEKLTFALSTDGTTPIASTAKDVVFTKVGISDFVSYEVAAPSAIFNDTATHSFKVYGVKADGTKSLLEKSQYNLVAPAVFTVNGANDNTIALTSALASTVIDADDTTTTVPLTKDYTFKVVINDTAATTITKVVTVSQEAKKVVDFQLTSDGTSDGTALTKLAYEASVAAGDDADIVNLAAAGTPAANVGKLNMTTLENNIYYVDQYGNETTTPVAGTVYLTFANAVDKDTTTPLVITKNGSDSTLALVDNLQAGDTLNTTITIGSISKTFVTEIK